jgi:hypothetical protein
VGDDNFEAWGGDLGTSSRMGQFVNYLRSSCLIIIESTTRGEAIHDSLTPGKSPCLSEGFSYSKSSSDVVRLNNTIMVAVMQLIDQM